MFICLSVTTFSARVLITAVQACYYDFAKGALLKSYGIIYLSIGAVIYDLLTVSIDTASNETSLID